jgi:putative SOS response-associated peptidase YedK
MINARAETVTEKRAFAQLIGKPSHRALLIADGYIEWKRGESRKAPRQPFIHRVDGGEPFAFPALWTRSEVGASGSSRSPSSRRTPTPSPARSTTACR